MGLQIARKTGQEVELKIGNETIRVLIAGRSTKLEIIASQRVTVTRPDDPKAKWRRF